MQRNRKDIASSFLQLVAAGSVREAFGEYIAGNFRHHNPSCAGDAHALMLAMEENASAMPQKRCRSSARWWRAIWWPSTRTWCRHRASAAWR